jgi:hypothetical protein
MIGTESRRLQRLAEELEESGLHVEGSAAFGSMLLEEVDHALRPTVHERRAASSGTILQPRSDPTTWTAGTELHISRTPLRQPTVAAARRFINGLSSWLVRREDDDDSEWVLFDRPAGSERDLAILADVMDATIVQRHPSDVVRIAGPFGVLRWAGLTWHHEPPVRSWIDSVSPGPYVGDRKVLEALLLMAVHDLGSLGIGALLVYRRSHLRCGSANRLIWPRCATPWPRPTGPPCSTSRVCSASWASVWCPAPTRNPRSTPWAEPATPRGSATATTIRPPRSSW